MEQEGVIKFQYKFFPYPAVHSKNIETLNHWRNILYNKKLIGQSPDRYDGAGYGNVSKRCPPFYQTRNKRSFFITGSQTGLIQKLSPEHYTTVLEYYPQDNYIIAEGPTKPSSESLTHGAIYDADDTVRYVFHTHDPGIWHRATEMNIPTTNANVAYGTVEMAEEVKRLFRSTNVRDIKILSMAGHEDGVISFGRSAEEAGNVMLQYFSKGCGKK